MTSEDIKHQFIITSDLWLFIHASNLLPLNSPPHPPKSFKYLGTVIDSKLIFRDNVVYVYKKAQQRLHFLRQLRSFRVGSQLLESVYSNLVWKSVGEKQLGWHDSTDSTASKII